MPPRCPAVRLFGILSKRWMLTILHAVFGGTHTFNALKRQLGSISSRTLSARLKDLEEEGFVVREVTGDRPLRVEYRPTPRGTELEVHLRALGDWARTYGEAGG